MTTKPDHPGISALPWTLEHPRASICDFTGRAVATILDDLANEHSHSKANAAYIVKACNAHPLLVEALEKCYDVLRHKAATCRNSSWKKRDQDAFDAAQLALSTLTP